MKSLVFIFIIFVTANAISEDMIHNKQIRFFGKFDNFARWTSEHNNREKFVIGVLGFNPFGDKLKEYYASRTVSKRKVDIKEIESLDEIVNCHILYISQSAFTLEEVLKASSGKGVLLISFEDGFAQKGVHLNYYLDNGKLRMELNPYASKRDGLNFKSNLIRAMRVVGTP